MATDPARGARYRFVIRGELGDHFAVVFEGMQIRRHAGTSVLTGNVVDQAHLLGLVERIQELGLELISVEPDQPDGLRDTRPTAEREGGDK